jgi:CBS domain-containing protein
MAQWRVRDVMTPEVITVPADASVAEIAAVLAEHGISGVPIVDRFDVVVGVVSWKDLHNRIETDLDADGRRRWRQVPAPARWAVADAVEVMSAAPVTVGPDATLAAAGRLMHRHGHSRLLVVDDRHQLLGIITRADLLKVHARLDAVIEDEVKERVLLRILRIQPDGVRVTVDDGVVTLSGRTARRTTALAAVALAEAVPGVAGVVDHLASATDDTVGEPAPTPAALDPLHGWWTTLRPDRSVADGAVNSDSARAVTLP